MGQSPATADRSCRGGRCVRPRLGRAEHGTPRLDPTDLNRLLPVLAVEEVKVQKVVDGKLLDSLSLYADNTLLSQACMQLPLCLLAVTRARVRRLAPRSGFTGQLVFEPEPARRFTVAPS